MEMTGCGSEAQLFDSNLVLAEFEAVFEAEAAGLAPMVLNNPDSVEQQAVSDRIDGHKDQTESNNVVVVEVLGTEVLDELLKPGVNDGGELMDVEVLEDTSMAEVNVKPQNDADGVGNEQKTTGELGDENSDNLWPDTEEGRAAFVKDVEAFYKGNNLVFRRPKFYKEELNLLKLWNAVIDLGGYEKVTSCKMWKYVGELFNPPKTCTTASWIFRHYYEKALLAYEKHKKPDLQPPHSVPSLVEPISVVSPLPDGEVCHIIKDKSSSPAPKSDNQPKTSGSLKRKKPSATEHGDGVGYDSRFGTMLFDIGAPADNVTVKVKKTDNSYEVYALIPGFRPHEVNVQSDPAGLFVVISGEPKVLDDLWGVASFKKVVLFPSKIDPSKTSAVITERVQVYVCAPFEISDESK
ncbi:hypothetical protein HRI_001140200 [Hibiscus trionum]|uniref:ARID domain-containing protein n=1 Tax=Hibiscus trionum TaxID=183268 RepID=A0A9W7HC11_HIBTR|nr:hypothetical protein HRI_001140200 [Hibiscus trionum]